LVKSWLQACWSPLLVGKEGKDYYPGITTTGPDNILHATVIVSG